MYLFLIQQQHVFKSVNYIIYQSQVEKAPVQSSFSKFIPAKVRQTNSTSVVTRKTLPNILKSSKKREFLEAQRKAKLQRFEVAKQRQEEQKRIQKEKRLLLKAEKKKLKEKDCRKRLRTTQFQTDREDRKSLIERFDEDYKPILGPVITELCKMQIKRTKLRTVRYSPLLMDIAVDLMRHCTQKVYNYLTTILPLPSFSTVRCYAYDRRDVSTAEAEKNRSCELDPSQSQQTDEINSSDDDLTFDEDSDIENEATCEVNKTSVCTNNETHPIPQQTKNFHLSELHESFSLELVESNERKKCDIEYNKSINREDRASPSFQPLQAKNFQLPELDESFPLEIDEGCQEEYSSVRHLQENSQIQYLPERDKSPSPLLEKNIVRL